MFVHLSFRVPCKNYISKRVENIACCHCFTCLFSGTAYSSVLNVVFTLSMRTAAAELKKAKLQSPIGTLPPGLEISSGNFSLTFVFRNQGYLMRFNYFLQTAIEF